MSKKLETFNLNLEFKSDYWEIDYWEIDYCEIDYWEIDISFLLEKEEIKSYVLSEGDNMTPKLKEIMNINCESQISVSKSVICVDDNGNDLSLIINELKRIYLKYNKGGVK